MAEVLLLHHACGLTDGVRAFADRLRDAGHTVHAPDLFEGRRFDTVEAGVAHAQEIGFDTVTARGRAAADGLSDGFVPIGFSLGVVPAQMLAQTHPGVGAAVLVHSCLPVGEFGEAWPDGVPVQVHGMDRDPWFVDEGDIQAAEALVASTAGAELFLYPGDAHLFADSSLPSYDESAAALVLQRVLALLGRVG
ncbi:dienelactone hydrolase [Actinotalea ferrariae CF5-4]|uniref:Dienelactone hydrolase n=1 Tax=Actinotalea ferrariae CF5-4 TaxID=948458 RepID=A0A021VS80_9CELL|nr:dienelactone hydrolase family protein [Actinotalea ferrariae]EYR62885.1 dienelactone hydrolase [Actinotalea ferrariae CF5-4]